MERTGSTGANGATHPDDGKAVAHVEGIEPASDQEFEDAFEVFRSALNEAWRRGSIRSMRVAVEAYDKFADVARRSN